MTQEALEDSTTGQDNTGQVTAQQTEPAEQTDSAAQEESSAPGYGLGEVLYVLSLGPEPHQLKNLELMQVANEFTTAPSLALGVSSLVAKGEVAVENGEFSLRGGAQMLAETLNNAIRWTEVVASNEQLTATALFVQAPLHSLLLQPGPMNTWFVFRSEPDTSPARLLLQMAQDSSLSDPATTTYFATQKISGPKSHLFVRTIGDDNWEVSQGAPEGQKVTSRTASTEQLVGYLEKYSAAS